LPQSMVAQKVLYGRGSKQNVTDEEFVLRARQTLSEHITEIGA
jgi:hypothetical protein